MQISFHPSIFDVIYVFFIPIFCCDHSVGPVSPSRQKGSDGEGTTASPGPISFAFRSAGRARGAGQKARKIHGQKPGPPPSAIPPYAILPFGGGWCFGVFGVVVVAVVCCVCGAGGRVVCCGPWSPIRGGLCRVLGGCVWCLCRMGVRPGAWCGGASVVVCGCGAVWWHMALVSGGVWWCGVVPCVVCGPVCCWCGVWWGGGVGVRCVGVGGLW